MCKRVTAVAARGGRLGARGCPCQLQDAVGLRSVLHLILLAHAEHSPKAAAPPCPPAHTSRPRRQSVGHRCPLCPAALPRHVAKWCSCVHPLPRACCCRSVFPADSPSSLNCLAAPPRGWACPSAPLSWRRRWTHAWQSWAATAPSTRCWSQTTGWQPPSSCDPCAPGRTRTLAASARVRAGGCCGLLRGAAMWEGGGVQEQALAGWCCCCCRRLSRSAQ